MASFQAKIGWKRPRKRENKSYRSVSFLPNASYKISKKEPKKVGTGCGWGKIKIPVPSWSEIEN